MRIAMISEHASPLAALGGEDAGGQNTHIAELSAALARDGHDVRVYTRRDSAALAPIVDSRDGYAVVHVPAGPGEPVPKDALLPYMPAFGRWLTARWRSGEWAPDVVHAHFWMSGLAGLDAARAIGVPVVQTFHALGTVKRRHQGDQDTSPRGRLRCERALGRSVDRVIAQCRDEVEELRRMGVPRSRIAIVPSGVDCPVFTPNGPAVPGRPGSGACSPSGGASSGRGCATPSTRSTKYPMRSCDRGGGSRDRAFGDEDTVDAVLGGRCGDRDDERVGAHVASEPEHKSIGA